MNSKNKKIIIGLIITVLVAILAGVAIYLYMFPKKTTVYLFNNSYHAGETVTSQMLLPTQVDSGIIVAGKGEDTASRFVTKDDIEDILKSKDSLRIDVTNGMPLTFSMLTTSGGSNVEVNMDPTKIAITVAVDGVSGVTNDLKDGSRVNIYAAGVGNEGVTLILQNMRVLDVSYKDDGELTSATIECSQNDALKLVYASTYSKVYFGLVDASGYQNTQNEEPAYIPGGGQPAVEEVVIPSP